MQKPPEEMPTEAQEQLDLVQMKVQFGKELGALIGNGIENVGYASVLAEMLVNAAALTAQTKDKKIIKTAIENFSMGARKGLVKDKPTIIGLS